MSFAIFRGITMKGFEGTMALRSLVIFLLLLLSCVNGICQEKGGNTFTANPIQGPVFDNDPSNQKFREWVIENTDWSWLSEFDSIGRIVVSFKVDRRGNLVNPTISRGLEPHIDAAVLQTVKSSPKWKPAKKNNRAVSSRQEVEIVVMLR